MIPLRAKINGCVSRGGIADPDAPNCQQSTKFWASVAAEQKTEDDDTTSVRMQSRIDPRHAMQAFQTPLGRPGSSVAIPDPMGFVRQFSSLAAQPSQSAAPATPQPGSGLGCLPDMFGHI